MLDVTGVSFRQAGKVYYFDSNNLKYKLGDHVIVETARGIEYGVVVKENFSSSAIIFKSVFGIKCSLFILKK